MFLQSRVKYFVVHKIAMVETIVTASFYSIVYKAESACWEGEVVHSLSVHSGTQSGR